MSLLVVDDQLITAAQSQAEVKTLVASQMTDFSELVHTREQTAMETFDTYDLVTDELTRLSSIERIRDLIPEISADDYILGFQGVTKGGFCPIGYEKVEEEECLTTFLSFLKSKGKPDAHAQKHLWGHHTGGCWMYNLNNHDKVHYNTSTGGCHSYMGSSCKAHTELPVCKRNPGTLPFDVTTPPEDIDDNCVPKDTNAKYHQPTQEKCQEKGVYGQDACIVMTPYIDTHACEWKGPDNYVAPPISCVPALYNNVHIQNMCKNRTTQNACIAKLPSQNTAMCKWNP